MNYQRQYKNDIAYYEVDYHRYVIHFLAIADTYNKAVIKAKKLGGKAYRAKWFGGGIVFDTNDDIGTLTQKIKALQNEEE